MDDGIPQAGDPTQPAPFTEPEPSDTEDQPVEQPPSRRGLWGLLLVIVNDFFAEPKPSDTEDQPVEQPRRRRGLLGLLLVIVNTILLIIIVILLTQYGGYQGTRTEGGSEQKIETVESMKPMPGTVSVWIKDSATIERVLVRAQVTPSRITDMAEGRYIVEVADGDAQGAAERIAVQKGVYDAGMVYGPPATP